MLTSHCTVFLRASALGQLEGDHLFEPLSWLVEQPNSFATRISQEIKLSQKG